MKNRRRSFLYLAAILGALLTACAPSGDDETGQSNDALSVTATTKAIAGRWRTADPLGAHFEFYGPDALNPLGGFSASIPGPHAKAVVLTGNWRPGPGRSIELLPKKTPSQGLLKGTWSFVVANDVLTLSRGKTSHVLAFDAAANADWEEGWDQVAASDPCFAAVKARAREEDETFANGIPVEDDGTPFVRRFESVAYYKLHFLVDREHDTVLVTVPKGSCAATAASLISTYD